MILAWDGVGGRPKVGLRSCELRLCSACLTASLRSSSRTKQYLAAREPVSAMSDR